MVTVKQIVKQLTIFIVIGLTYFGIEMTVRGRSDISMIICAGVIGVIVGLLNDIFSYDMLIQTQLFIGSVVATVCEGVISQQLLQTIDGRKRVAALEVMVATPAIRNLIRENKTYQIPNMIQTGSKFGMQSMDQELVNLYRQGSITRDSVLSRCTDYEYTSRLVGDRC